MASAAANTPPPPADAPANRPVSAKVVVSGGFGVGKTTIVSSISEIAPLRTEAKMTTAASGVDDATYVQQKTSTTVAMDFGKLTVEEGLVLYVFGTPGQDRFGFMWKDITEGALGAMILVDTRRLDDCFPAIDYFESRDIPFIVVLNQFDNAPSHQVEDIREALDISDTIPIIRVDARSEQSAKDALIRLLGHILETLSAKAQEEVRAVAPDPQQRQAPVVTNDMRARAASALAAERSA